MHISRLLEIVYILLDKKLVTARELADHFEVSQRTILRDIDSLSGAGIPVYTSKGKGGGISLLDNYVLNKSILSDKEQLDIISSLQGLNALNIEEVEPVLNKLGTMFNKKCTSWIDVDFTCWGSNSTEQDKFNLLKNAVIKQNVVIFQYFSSYGEVTERIIEPLKLIYKGRGWYVYGFCRAKKDFRFFKISRIRKLTCTEETFERDIPDKIWEKPENYKENMVRLILKIDERMAYRIYDEFDQDSIIKNKDGSFNVAVEYYEDEWVYGYVMSFGSFAEVLEPEHIRNIIKKRFEDGLKKYL